jgi:hypothetical protein
MSQIDMRTPGAWAPHPCQQQRGAAATPLEKIDGIRTIPKLTTLGLAPCLPRRGLRHRKGCPGWVCPGIPAYGRDRQHHRPPVSLCVEGSPHTRSATRLVETAWGWGGRPGRRASVFIVIHAHGRTRRPRPRARQRRRGWSARAHEVRPIAHSSRLSLVVSAGPLMQAKAKAAHVRAVGRWAWCCRASDREFTVVMRAMTGTGSASAPLCTLEPAPLYHSGPFDSSGYIPIAQL